MAFFQNGKLDGKLVSPGDRRMEDDGRGFKFSSTMFCKFVSNGVSFAFITFLGHGPSTHPCGHGKIGDSIRMNGKPQTLRARQPSNLLPGLRL